MGNELQESTTVETTTPLLPHERARLRAESMCAESTIDNWWSDRSSVRDATDQRLTRAARDIGITHSSDAAKAA